MSKLLKKILAPQGTLPDPEDSVIEIGSGYAVIVDTEDFERLSAHRWFAKRSAHNIYAVRKVVSGGHEHLIRMHREIVNCPGGFIVHHKNHNTLDNRKVNLEICTPENHKYLNRITVDNNDIPPI
ncbi:hypothetical protein ES705_36004 [subsurface metagenome]